MKSSFIMLKIAFVMLAFALSCGPGAKGLAPTKEGPGPRVVFDLAAKPLPEIPLPNDAATVIDPSTNTGLRVNISEIAPTLIESDTRAKVDKIDGFGVFSPITVSFSKEIDLGDLLQRHSDTKFRNDAVFVVNVDPESKYYGTFVPLNMCRGNYPLTLFETGDKDQFFSKSDMPYMAKADVHAWDNNVLFDERNEDTNGNGLLDPGEDTDFDGHLDVPNIYPLHACDGQREILRQQLLSPQPDQKKIKKARKNYDLCMTAHLLTCYERETNTLIMEPLLPLDQHSRYAVVITKRVKDKAGNPVVSPFPYVNALDQTDALKPLKTILPKVGLSVNDIAFAWSFTTQSLTQDMETIRKGLYGFGPMAWLSRKFPVSEIYPAVLTDEGQNPYVVNMDKLMTALTPLLPVLAGSGNKRGIKVLLEDLKHVDHLVIGKFYSPYFLVDKDGVATPKYPADDDESFDMNPLTGKAVVGGQWVGYMCTIPKVVKGKWKQPFPVVLYAHGYLGLLSEQLGFAGRMAAFGIASCSIEAMGHGIALPKDMQGYLDIVKKLLKKYHLGPLWAALSPGRARDLNNDGIPDMGGDFWTADLFHTRDVVRQTLVDYMQFIRILRSFDGQHTWATDVDGDGMADLAGDFDADGIPDLGGGTHPYGAWGQSLGGFIAALLSALDPAVQTTSPVCGGAALTGIALRSKNPGVPEAVMMPLLGPIIMGHETDDHGIELSFLLNDLINKAVIPFYTSHSIQAGDRLMLENLNNGKTAYVIVPDYKDFRFTVPADALTATEKRAVLGMLDDNSNVPVTVTDPTAIADRLRITVYDHTSGQVKEVIDHFDRDVLWQGALFPAGSPFVAIQKGLGYMRQTHDLRKMLSTAAFILEAADPGAFGRYYYLDHLDFSYEDELPDSMGHFFHKDPKDPSKGIQPKHIMVVSTAGDMNVPVSTEIAMARSAMIINVFDDEADALLAGIPKALFEKSHRSWPKLHINNPNDLLIHIHALNPIDRLYGLPPDPDNLSRGHDPDSGNFTTVDPPLRLTIPWDHGYQLFRMPYHPEGDRHGFDVAEPDRCRDPKTRDHCFDMNYFMTNAMAFWMYTHGDPVVDGKFVLDDPCMEKATCSFFPASAHSKILSGK